MENILTTYYNYFFLLIILFYNFFPKFIRRLILLFSGFILFYLLSGKLISFLVVSIISIYLSALLIDNLFNEEERKLANTQETKERIKKQYKTKRLLVLLSCFLINFSFLFIFKYFNFFAVNSNYLFKGLGFTINPLKLIAPIGISFYTLQALSYLFDVYNKKICADKNLLRVSLFISFFPQIMEGPIARYEDTAESIYAARKISYNNLCYGLQRVLLGLFKKIVIANRLNIIVKTIFNHYAEYNGLSILLGGIAFTVMLYMDFSGAMDVVSGIGDIFSVKVPPNFKQPFFSKSISEFWMRWHISLGKWFKDYVYYPLSLSKNVRKLGKICKKYFGTKTSFVVKSTIALLAVWLLNGLWHGAGWTYILFGLYHFMLIFLGGLTEPLINNYCIKKGIDRNKILYRTIRILKVFFLVVIGEIIFRAESVKIAISMIINIFTKFSFSLTELKSLGIDLPDFIILIFALLTIFIVSILKERGVPIREEISKKPIFTRWLIYYFIIFAIIIFGAYGPGYEPVDPIYADF